MRQLRDDTHLILDGEVRVYRRERSKRWQAAFVIDGHIVRISTGKRDLAEAKEYARETFLEYKFRHKNDLPVVTKKFSDVAKLAIADMRWRRCCWVRSRSAAGTVRWFGWRWRCFWGMC